MKKQTILLSLCFLLALLMPTAALADVTINTTNFPDTNFRTIVKKFDKDGNGTLSSDEIEKVTEIYCISSSIQDLKGIEYFTSLTSLYCTGNYLSSLDLSNNLVLTTLYCSHNELSSLDLSHNTALTTLYCNSNLLTSLDLSHNTALTTLDYNSNSVSSIDLSHNTVLTNLSCDSNSISSLDLSHNTALTTLSCESNSLRSLDLSHNIVLGELQCYSNNITSLDLSNNTVLTHLYCNSNWLVALDLSQNTALTYLACNSNKLTSLDLSNNTKLTDFSCISNSYSITPNSDRTFDLSTLPGSFDTTKASAWSSLDAQDNSLAGVSVNNNVLTVPEGATKVTYAYDCGHGETTTFTLLVEESVPDGIPIDAAHFPDDNFREKVVRDFFDKDNNGYLNSEEIAAITQIDCSSKSIASLKGIEYFTALEALNCRENNLTQLDLSKNTALTDLNVGLNQLTKLDVTKNTALRTFQCYNNQLTELNLGQKTMLESLDCGNNQLTTLDISSCTALTGLTCHNNLLTNLDISNSTKLVDLYCEENKLTKLDISKNAKLEQIECYKNELTELDTSKNPVLRYLSCYENKLTKLDIIDTIKYLHCSYNQLTELNVSSNSGLELLTCDANNLTELNVSQNPLLRKLTCSGNQLTELDVSQNAKLEQLNCTGNNLTTLDVHSNSALKELRCEGNQFVELDVSQNANLEWLDCYFNQLTSLDVSHNPVLTKLDAEPMAYTIKVATPRTFDLTTLPGDFDVSKASSWKGGTVSGNTLTVDADVTQVTYSYDCGNNYSVTFTLNVTQLYTITFDTDGGSDIAPITQEANTPVTAPANPTKPGYAFAGWDKAIPATMPAENITIKVKWSANAYTITFDTDGGSSIPAITQAFGTVINAPADPTKTGYTFAGWKPEIPATMPAENITVKAQWSANMYTITFDTDGGTSIPDITQTFGTPVTAPANPTKPGYTFVGWEPEIPATMPAENITIKAKWTQEILHTIEFQIETPESCKVELDPGVSQTVKDGESFSFTLHILDGYVKTSAFAVKANGVTLNPIQSSRRQTGETYRIDNIHDSQVVTITGLKKAAYTVSVTGSYATPSGEGSYTAGETVSLDAGTLKGYDFDGWTVTDGNVTLANAKQAKTTFVMPGHNVALTANWKQQSGFALPQTGDNSRVLLWSALLAGCTAALVCMKKKKK